jgi:hypothetical protein
MSPATSVMPSDLAKLTLAPGHCQGIAHPVPEIPLTGTTVPYAKAFPAMCINAVAPGFAKIALNAFPGCQSAGREYPAHRAHDANRLPANQTRRPGPQLTEPLPGRITLDHAGKEWC